MLSTISELCEAASKYLLTVSIGNKNKIYIPTGSLKNGNVLKHWDYSIKVPTYEGNRDDKASVLVKTSESIPYEYTKSVTDFKIQNDWNQYAKEYVYTKIDSKTHISNSSMFYFIYLFRYFIDKHFKMFTDIYGRSFVWLYNKGNVSYSPENITLEEQKTITVPTIEKYINVLIDEIVNRDTIQTLQASTSISSCSSSSSSSSCSSSSSSSSSSCSCSSSSSSSSMFIAYFNLTV